MCVVPGGSGVRSPPGMAGDGGNDCGGLRAAHAGLALSDAEARLGRFGAAETEKPRGSRVCGYDRYDHGHSHGFPIFELGHSWVGMTIFQNWSRQHDRRTSMEVWTDLRVGRPVL